MNASREMPKYQCHKQVWALKIDAIAELGNPDPTGQSAASSYGAILTPTDFRFTPFQVDANYMNKHQPQVGGYYVVYEGGYKSFSPADAFESGYALMQESPSTSNAATKQTDQSIEQEIQSKGLTAPRVTPADIEANIASEHYFTGEDGRLGAYKNNGDVYMGDWPTDQNVQALGLLTFCVLVLKNGFTVTGESACASPENFNAEIGRKIARENAISEIWPPVGYALKEKLSTQPV